MRSKFLRAMCLIGLLLTLTLMMPPSVTAGLPAVGGLNTTPNNCGFIVRLYQDLLNRTPTSSDLSYWQGLLDTGTTRMEMAQTLLASAEYRTGLIQGWYQKFLGRSATNSEVSFWLAQLGAGATDEQVIASFVASTEYFNRAGGTNSGFVNQLYQDLLGRAPSSVELSFGLTFLASNSRSQYALTLLASTEYLTDLVQGWYQKFLGRSATGAEANAWVTAMQSGTSDEAVIAAIVSSPEYASLAGGCGVYLPLIMR